MKELRTEIKVKATPEKIWGVLTDFEKFPDWNPMMRSLKGNLVVGEKVTVRLEQPGSAPMTFKPTITKVQPIKEFRWQGHLLFPGIFDGEHFFEINDNKDGTCTFNHGENFKGILIPLFGKILDVNTRQAFELMNQGLKERCEQ